MRRKNDFREFIFWASFLFLILFGTSIYFRDVFARFSLYALRQLAATTLMSLTILPPQPIFYTASLTRITQGENNIPVFVTSNTPNAFGHIYDPDFFLPFVIKLAIRYGNNEVIASDLVVEDDEHLRATFSIPASQPPGQYDIVVISNESPRVEYLLSRYVEVRQLPMPFTGGGGGGGGGGGIPVAVAPLPRVNVGTVNLAAITSESRTGSQSLFVFYRTLQLGSRGEDVAALQSRLKNEVAYSGPITSYFGTQTAQAVKMYQKKYNISQIGIVGPLTRAKLNEVIVPSIQSPPSVNAYQEDDVAAVVPTKESLQAKLRILKQQLRELLNRLLLQL